MRSWSPAPNWAGSLLPVRGNLLGIMQRDFKWSRLDGPTKPLVLTVSFIGGSVEQRTQVMTYAPDWEEGTGIRFYFQDSPGQIRVSFRRNLGNVALVGSAANLATDQNNPTMNLSNTDQGTVLHEFGHALGLSHKHVSPNANIPWNKEEVYKFYLERHGWDHEMVDTNIFEFISPSEPASPCFDEKSIMLYNIPEQFLLPDKETGERPEAIRGFHPTLSPEDRHFIAEMYPAPIQDEWPDFTKRIQILSTKFSTPRYVQSGIIPNAYKGEILWTDGRPAAEGLLLAGYPDIKIYNVIRKTPNMVSGTVTASGFISSNPSHTKFLGSNNE
ncbi:hypothetical protein AN958_09358 [Leucoagaricus sp. SymC.cos]|nr:hypothetical protein AN958_09358 [Leucoagaricus sp. SymC.cos]